MKTQAVTTTNQPQKLSLWAPETPGASQTLIGLYDTLADAERAAERFDGRRDLSFHDVVIRAGREGRIIERCGPCR